MPVNKHERILNERLADLLRDEGLKAEGESPATWVDKDKKKPVSGQIDIKIDLPSGQVVVAIEAKNGYGNKKAALKDAQKRVDDGTAQIGIAVCYPDGLNSKENLTRDTEILVSPLDGQWQETTPCGLAQTVRFTIYQAGSPDDAERILAFFEGTLDSAARQLNDEQCDALAEALELPSK